MSTKRDFSPVERDYHDAYTYLRLIRRVERDLAFIFSDDHFFQDPAYCQAIFDFDACLPIARSAARRSLSMRGQNERSE